jgi:hypothetical protein
MGNPSRSDSLGVLLSEIRYGGAVTFTSRTRFWVRRIRPRLRLGVVLSSRRWESQRRMSRPDALARHQTIALAYPAVQNLRVTLEELFDRRCHPISLSVCGPVPRCCEPTLPPSFSFSRMSNQPCDPPLPSEGRSAVGDSRTGRSADGRPAATRSPLQHRPQLAFRDAAQLVMELKAH